MAYYSIAIDGPSGAGKSSMAKAVAKKYNFIYVDTGAIYRTVGLAAHRRGISCSDETDVAKILPELRIEMKYDDKGEQRMYLDGEDVSSDIRLPEISICASDVSALPAVRAFLLDMQRAMARTNSVIMDGRDIGTVVLPNADVKIFLTASSSERARRRLLQLKEKGINEDFEKVLKEIEYRDKQDSSRDIAPLKPADDAVIIDSSEIDFDGTVALISSVIEERLHQN